MFRIDYTYNGAYYHRTYKLRKDVDAFCDYVNHYSINHPFTMRIVSIRWIAEN